VGCLVSPRGSGGVTKSLLQLCYNERGKPPYIPGKGKHRKREKARRRRETVCT